jgi:hypothetical protein
MTSSDKAKKKNSILDVFRIDFFIRVFRIDFALTVRSHLVLDDFFFWY